MPRSHINGSPRRFHYGSNPRDDPGNDNFRSPMRIHNASTTTYVYGCNTEIYRLIRIATDDAGSYPWLILSQIHECVTWALHPSVLDNRITVGPNKKISVFRVTGLKILGRIGSPIFFLEKIQFYAF